MNVYSLYFSPTGGTQRVADCLCSALRNPFAFIDLCDRTEDFSAVSLNKDDLCVISVPSYGGRIPALAAERIAHIRGNGAMAVAVCVYGNRAYDDTLLEMKHLLTDRGFRCIAAMAAIAEHSMLRQFAAGRPNESDRAELTAFARRISRAIATDTFVEDLAVPGAFPYRPIGSFVKPVASEECIGCGACAASCPAGAIPEDNPSFTDNALCAACTRCISVCPVGARQLNPDVMKAVEARLAPLLSGYRKNELFL